jgi:succinoglycan biosynthesis protein ExoA
MAMRLAPIGPRSFTSERPFIPKQDVISCSERKKISIVVACRNEAKHIDAFLDSLLKQEFDGFDWEAIIADGQSTDGTRERISEVNRTNPRIQLIDNSSQIVAAGLNAAIKVAGGDIILRMDAHTEYNPNYVAKCVETLETTGASNVGGPARTKAEGLHARAIQAAFHSWFSTGGACFHDDRFSGYVDTVPYGCWRKETFNKVGLFDEHLVRNQDDEFNLRIIRSGGRIWQSSGIISWYRPRPTLASLFRQYFQYGFWKVPVIRKHKIPGSWRHMIPGAFILTNLTFFFAILGSWLLKSRLIGHEMYYLEGILILTYVVACLVAACFSARRFGWQLFPYLPATFAVFHCSYGLGFLSGLVYTPFAGSSRKRLGKLFEGITR